MAILTQSSGMAHQSPPLARRSRRQRAQGIETEEKVWQCYVSGRQQVSIAIELGLSESRVSRYLKRRFEKIEQGARQSPQELAVMRERLAAGIWATVEETHMKPVVLSPEQGGTELTVPTPPKLLMIRLKALEQLAKLYGLHLEPQARQEELKPYSTPAEIADEVRTLILARYHRCPQTGQRLDHSANASPPPSGEPGQGT